MATMRLRASYYQQFDADPSLDVPGEGYGGWQEADVEISAEHTAVVVMHAWDAGTRAQYHGAPNDATAGVAQRGLMLGATCGTLHFPPCQPRDLPLRMDMMTPFEGQPTTSKFVGRRRAENPRRAGGVSR